MNEIEVKVLEINRRKVLKRLKSLAAKKIFGGVLKTVYFDFPDFALQKQKQVLRLRKSNQKTFLTFKTRLPNKKSVASEEIEFEVADFFKAQKFLKRLGLVSILVYEKKRESYRAFGVRMELDKFLGKFKKIPLFLEIEAHSEKELFGALKQLGFSQKDAKAWHGGQLLSHYGFRLVQKNVLP